MSLSEQIFQSLTALKGFSSESPRTVAWSVDEGTQVEAEFTIVDSLSCAVRELRISAPDFSAAPVEALREWADGVCQDVTYLLEPLGLLETDHEAQSILIRSTPPANDGGRKAYYEMWVKAPGTVSLRRYCRAAGEDARHSVDFQVTHEALQKLIRNVVNAIPALERHSSQPEA